MPAPAQAAPMGPPDPYATQYNPNPTYVPYTGDPSDPTTNGVGNLTGLYQNQIGQIQTSYQQQLDALQAQLAQNQQNQATQTGYTQQDLATQLAQMGIQNTGLQQQQAYQSGQYALTQEQEALQGTSLAQQLANANWNTGRQRGLAQQSAAGTGTYNTQGYRETQAAINTEGTYADQQIQNQQGQLGISEKQAGGTYAYQQQQTQNALASLGLNETTAKQLADRAIQQLNLSTSLTSDQVLQAMGQLAEGIPSALSPILSQIISLMQGMAPAQSASLGAATSSALGGVGGTGSGPGTPAQNAALGQQDAAQFGWSGAEWTDLNNLVNRESGWNSQAQNPTSSAFGIAQDIQGANGPGYGTDPQTQIEWMLNYIKQRYGDPAAAWAHEESQGWY